ncbi:hypothetical protein CCACVL1_00677, partial [Corchorus capsularis]
DSIPERKPLRYATSSFAATLRKSVNRT